MDLAAWWVRRLACCRIRQCPTRLAWVGQANTGGTFGDGKRLVWLRSNVISTNGR